MIQIKNIKKTYNKYSRNAQTVLKEISLELPDKGFICILGESGCGKTTLMNVMGGLDTFDSGQLTVGEVTAKRYGTKAMETERNHKFGYVFQNYYMLMDRTVTYNVYLGLHSMPLSRREKLKRVKQALEAVGMLAYAKKKNSDLSGGQQQRVAIARALARQPEIIFADEPTGNLDEANTNQVCDLLRSISKNCLVVMVTHEKRIANQYADRIISLNDGVIVSDIINTPTVKEKDFSESLPGTEESLNRKKHSYWNMKTLWHEAMQLLTAKGHRTGWLYLCLMLLMAGIVLTIGDYLTAASIRPEEFLITDSRILEVNVIRGGVGGEDMGEAFDDYLEYLDGSGLDMTLLPLATAQTYYHHDSPFAQIGLLSERVQGFSYLPLQYLEEGSILYGRMATAPDEVVIDRYVAEKFMKGNGILLGSLEDVSDLLGQTLTLEKKQITLEIVGICESENMTVYVDKFALITIASAGNSVMGLSQLKAEIPGKYDNVTLGDREIYAGKNAGGRITEGAYVNMNNDWQCFVTGTVSEDIYASFVLRDDLAEAFMRDMIRTTRQFYVCSEEKEAVQEFLSRELPEELKKVIQVETRDVHTEYMEKYRAAVAEKLGARAIVTVTILLVSAIMLVYLLKARIQERLEFFTVYRLLGVPKGKTLWIIFLENICLSVTAALPAALLTYGIVTALNLLPSVEFSMVLPAWAVAVSYGAVLVFQLLAALLPAGRLLRYPPAQLASKYDF